MVPPFSVQGEIGRDKERSVERRAASSLNERHLLGEILKKGTHTTPESRNRDRKKETKQKKGEMEQKRAPNSQKKSDHGKFCKKKS